MATKKAAMVQAGDASGAEATAKAPKKEIVRTPVTLTTGEVVEFTEKQKVQKSVTVADGIVTVRFAFRNGEVREFRADKHHKLALRLLGHGASQKIGDEFSGESDIDDQVAAADAVIARLERGEWGAERAASGGFAGASVVIRAIAEVKGVDAGVAKAFIESTLAKYEAAGKPITRAALYASFRAPGTKTGAVIARLEAEKAAKATHAVEADDLLAEIEAPQAA